MFRISASLVVCLLVLTAGPVQASCVFALQNPVWYPAGNYEKNVAAADFNRDGYADVAVRLEDAIPNTIAVLLADGDGGLQAPVEYAMGSDELVGDIATGDINGDGYVDIVAATGASSTDNGRVNILLGNGAGGFAAGAPYLFPRFEELQNPYYLTVADFDHNGKDDVAVAAMTSLVVISRGATALTKTFEASLRADGDPYFLPEEIAHGDFDGDGHPDVALTDFTKNVIHTFFGDGDGTFTTGPTLPYDSAFFADGLTAGDFDGDGDDDLAHAEEGDADEGMRLNVYVSNGDARTFAPRVEHALIGNRVDEARASDIDGDGDIDVILSGISGVDVLLNDGAGNFPAKTTFGPYAFTLDIADVDGNGGPDVVTSSVHLFANSCAHTQATLTSSANPSIVNEAVAFTGTLSKPPSRLTPTGTFTLERDGTTLATDYLWSGLSVWHVASDLPVGVNTIIARYSGDPTFAATQVVLEQIVKLPPFGAPTQTSATYASGKATITWLGTEGVDHYEVWRRRGSDAWTPIATPTSAMFVDASVSASSAYLYKVLGVTSSNTRSPFGTPALTHTFAFTDPTLTAATTFVRLQHLTELRLAIDSARAAAGLATANWAEQSPTFIKASHWVEARTRLEEARSAIGIAAGTYASTPAGGSIVLAEHVRDLRDALE